MKAADAVLYATAAANSLRSFSVCTFCHGSGHCFRCDGHGQHAVVRVRGWFKRKRLAVCGACGGASACQLCGGAGTRARDQVSQSNPWR